MPTVTSYTLETEIDVTGLVPDVRYRVFVRAENELYDVDNTTSRSNNITVTLPEGGIATIVSATSSHTLSDVMGK